MATTSDGPVPDGRGSGRLLDRLADGYFRLLELLLVICLVAMVVMVFGNVVLRYGFDSCITVSEEMSRFAFVWLTFIGIITGVREGAHLGVDSLVRALPLIGKKICLVICELLILFCCALLFWGVWVQHDINMGNYAPVTGIPMEAVYAIAYLTSISVAILAIYKLVKLARGELREEEMIEVRESEELIELDTMGAAGERLPGHHKP